MVHLDRSTRPPSNLRAAAPLGKIRPMVLALQNTVFTWTPHAQKLSKLDRDESPLGRLPLAGSRRIAVSTAP